ncbi:uncharacterized protein LOC127093760 [Lathyrus oleraceus]|uniref:uncharacterized protein LOC127093760 n=1 Tax=Pisum sativum TaxID=3888 RepID=UPI0021D34D83|nr:uncharacterized protein LOC127093760 [Pisum sativum]
MLNTVQENLISQKAKIIWIKLGDGNNAFFHASLKSKHQMNHVKSLKNKDRILLTSHHELEEEILQFYGDLVGKSNKKMDSINLIAMRHGPHLNASQRKSLIEHVIDQEVKSALKGISDNTAPGINGFGGKFFKATWNTINKDVLNSIR